MNSRARGMIVALIVLLAIGIAAVQSVNDPIQIKMIQKATSVGGGGADELMFQLPGQFLVASLTGFREVIAGALWLRTETFFHSGKYQAIVPIVRLVTWLDPHNIDVYTTGAWHLDYNFVDSQQLSDKRYIPASIALLKEGIANNPDVYDIYFELGWTHYSKKLMDYDSAVKYLELACKKNSLDPNTGRLIDRPEFVDNMLAHAYERVGRFDDAIKRWQKSRKDLIAKLRKTQKGPHFASDQLDLIDRNLSLLYLRLAWRYGDTDAYAKGIALARGPKWRKKPVHAEWAVKGAEDDYKRRLAANDPPHDALTPLDLGFQVTWKRAAPKVILIKGKISLVPISEYKNLASECFTHHYLNDYLNADPDRKQRWVDGSRVYWRIEDYDYKMPDQKVFNWRIDTSKTVQGGGYYDGIRVEGGEFSQLVDLSSPADEDMYPFKARKYRLTIWWTPQEPTPDDVQDRVGWKGEAIRDKPEFLDVVTCPGFRMIRKEYIIAREQIL